MNLESVKAIFNKRGLITKAQIGKRVRLTVQSGGNVIDVENSDGEKIFEAGSNDGVVLQKKLFNLKCNSEVAIKNERNKGILKEANELEKAGDAEKAHDGYNDYLNKVQVSVGILSTASMFNKLQAGDEIAAQVQLITTENGELLTIDPSTISIMAPETVAQSSFDMAF